MDAAALTAALAPLADELITPALVVDLDAIDANIAASVRRLGRDRWRPHLKTSKQAVVIEALLAAGVRHVKVATLDELELLLATARERGANVDCVFAYPPHRACLAAMRRLLARRELAHPDDRVSVLADSPAHLGALSDWARELEWPGPLRVMPDVDLGMARTGSPLAAWREAWPKVGALPGVAMCGLHGYDGHLAWSERERAHAGYDGLCELAQATPQPASLELVTSGTHSYGHALAHAGLAAGPWLHRVSPGTIVLCDRRSHAAAADIGLRQAAFVVSRVISLGEGRVTLDAGSKAITPDGDPPSCAVLDHPELTPQRASEEHLPCQLVEGEGKGEGLPPLGELMWLIPDHVCTTVNLHREAVWLRGGRYAGIGPIAASGHRPRC